MTKNKKTSIAIVYLAIGKFDVFWEQFYSSCEQYFLPDAEKYYFLFTDSLNLLSQNYPHTSILIQEDRGWGLNASSKYNCILQIRNQLEWFEYIFYINANYQIHTPIYCNEILPDESNDYLVALSFDHFRPLTNDLYPYDRNPECEAYIPYGQGSYYYQSSFFGGRRQELMKLTEFCDNKTRIDLENGIMASWHDESYMNKYLLNLNPRRIDTFHCKPEEFDGESKAILRDKNKILGIQAINQIKAAFIHPALSYLRDKKMNCKPLHLIKTSGRLGNQMFQYAFLSGLRHQHPESIFRMYDAGEASYCIDTIFNLPDEDFATPELAAFVQKTPPYYIHEIREQTNAYQQPDTNWQLVSIYSGYWQTELYFKDIRQEIMAAFRFDEAKLNTASKRLADRIKSATSVSIHIRRGDYLTLTKTYGNICTDDYYAQAIQLMKIRLSGKDICFYLFSDEPEKIKPGLFPDNSVVVDCNQGEDAWQDMYLMSLCNHNIIANSSFSWWGAWLNQHENKIITAPYRWYNTMLAPDILPENWIRIYPSDYEHNKLVEDLIGNKLSLKNNGLLYGRMGLIVFLFNFGRIHKDLFCENMANHLLDSVIEKIDINSPLDYADGLSGIGTAIEYLLQNDFVKGNRDEIFEEFDQLFDRVITASLPDDLSFEQGIGGWIRYLKFRTANPTEGMSPERYSVNKRNRDYLEVHVSAKKTETTPSSGNFNSWDDSIDLRGKAGMELYRILPEAVRDLIG